MYKVLINFVTFVSHITLKIAKAKQSATNYWIITNINHEKGLYYDTNPQKILLN